MADNEKTGTEAVQSELPVEKHADTGQPPVPSYPSGFALVPIIIALCFAVLLVALDRTIIATAIPRITDEFDALSDVGWYGSSYMLTYCTFQLLYGRIYTFYPAKWVFLIVIFTFEVGSAICGAAPNSIVFIIGRAFAGIGASGIFNGATIITVDSIPLHKRPLYTGFLGAMFGIASVVAPLLGGVFTSDVSWRWCFYINLPVGGLAIVIIFLILKPTAPINPGSTTSQRIWSLDPIGNVCFFPSIICLLLALEWGGSTYAWTNGRIIALFVLFGVLFIGFIAIQVIRGEGGSIPPRVLKQRTIPTAMWFVTCTGSSMMLVVYYIPIWFQAIKGVSAVKSGIMTIPLLLSMILGSIGSGFITARIGYYNPFFLLCTVLLSVGTGMITTFTPSTGHAKWIGYQVLYGLGLGVGQPQPNLAAQTVLSRADIPAGIALIMLVQSLGGSVFLVVGENIFTNHLISALSGLSIDGLDAAQLVLNTGATDLRSQVAPEYLGQVLQAYNDALRQVFILALGIGCASVFGSTLIEWRSVKEAKKNAEPIQTSSDE